MKKLLSLALALALLSGLAACGSGSADPSDVTVIEEQTTNTSYQRTPKSCGSYSIRVRTKGIHADWGAWSQCRVVLWAWAGL